MEDDVEGFQMRPHRVGRVREAAVGKGVASQKETKLVIDKRLGDRQPRQDSQPHCQSRKTTEQDAQWASAGRTRFLGMLLSPLAFAAG